MKTRLLAVGVMVGALGGCGSSGKAGSGAAGASGGAGPTGAAGTTATGTAGAAGTTTGAAGTTTGAAGATTGAAGTTTGAAGTTTGTGGTTTAGLGGVAGPPTSLGDCTIFPSDDAWNTDVSGMAADATWTANLAALVGTAKIHPDFGSGFGIPINVVPATQAALPITFDDYPEESDPGPYPFPPPATVMIEGESAETCSGDCHVLVVQTGICMLYEGYGCKYVGGWHCANGAKWDLKQESYGQRKVGWTSADAAGLPIMPGILRRAEVVKGPLSHAVRFTAQCTTNKYVKPATHEAVPTNTMCDPKNPNPKMPPLGLRVRLKADYALPAASPLVQNILAGLKRYGMILADNGSNFFFQGDPDPAWTDDDLDQLKKIPATSFEAVAVPPLQP